MNTTETTRRLELKGIKATANRILVYRELVAKGCPLSLTDMEDIMPQMDKSSIFRVLTLFLEHDVVHSFTDGRGVVHYELCHDDGQCHHDDGHLHFYCESCQRSFCLDDVPLPEIVLPEGFVPHSVSFVVKGNCPDCYKKIER
ncbi:MAG: transcriptional repressor [Prevotella sp.]|nr:transcriptional repressor [Prevotella sp.]